MDKIIQAPPLHQGLEFIRCDEEKHTGLILQNYRFNNYYGVQLVYDGDFFFGNHSYQTPVVYFTDPFRPFTYGSPEGKFRSHIYVSFQGERIKSYQQMGIFPLQCTETPFSVRDVNELVSMMQEIIMYQRIPGDLNHFKAVNLLERLLLVLPQYRITEQELHPENSLYPPIRQLGAKISVSPALPWNFVQEAKRLSISKVYFNKLFQRLNHLPPHQFLLACRIALATKLLLNDRRMPIKAIAQECGFSDVFYFSRFFTKSKGLSPDNFRKRYQ